MLAFFLFNEGASQLPNFDIPGYDARSKECLLQGVLAEGRAKPKNLIQKVTKGHVAELRRVALLQAEISQGLSLTRNKWN